MIQLTVCFVWNTLATFPILCGLANMEHFTEQLSQLWAVEYSYADLIVRAAAVRRVSQTLAALLFQLPRFLARLVPEI
ncbi:hypothetical protein GGS21DRAFT_277393 [Xylaria nigripes]|nr:hypothetical protein GGS21DRAFT_277393 [Xylaria nigripes]